MRKKVHKKPIWAELKSSIVSGRNMHKTEILR